jgi:hypothetical protein
MCVRLFEPALTGAPGGHLVPKVVERCKEFVEDRYWPTEFEWEPSGVLDQVPDREHLSARERDGGRVRCCRRDVHGLIVASADTEGVRSAA